MAVMSPPLGARRFQIHVRWSSYGVVTAPAASLIVGATWSDRFEGTHPTVLLSTVALTLGLAVGNVLVTRWSINTVVGRSHRFPAVGGAVWVLALCALVTVAFLFPDPAIGPTVAAAVASVAASVVPVLGVNRTLVLNALVVVLAVPLVGVADVARLLVGAAMITVVLWACWSSAWMLRVLLDLQAAHEDRAALALANERLRISRDLHDVFGRTLATIAVKSSLASELVRRGRNGPASEEITEVRRLAEEAGSEVRRVVRGEHRTTWKDELSGARSLLASAGIDCTVTGDAVPEEHAEALAWVVREGVTNLLRHSAATRVTLTTRQEDGALHLTIANDGAGPADPARIAEGTGLSTMSERVHARGGRVTSRHEGDWFRLDARVPLHGGST